MELYESIDVHVKTAPPERGKRYRRHLKWCASDDGWQTRLVVAVPTTDAVESSGTGSAPGLSFIQAYQQGWASSQPGTDESCWAPSLCWPATPGGVGCDRGRPCVRPQVGLEGWPVGARLSRCQLSDAGDRGSGCNVGGLALREGTDCPDLQEGLWVFTRCGYLT
jgi:hypothetical protein